MNSNDATHQEFYEGWQFLYYLSRQTDDCGFVGVAEVRRQGRLYCKLVSLSPAQLNDTVLDGLRLQGEAWVADWAARPDAGDTVPTPLE